MTRRPLPPHSDAAHEAIRAELVRATLGGRPRPELLPPARPLETYP